MQDINEIFDDQIRPSSHEDQWISLSDLMSSLMLIFMLIAMAYMLKTQADAASIVKYSEQVKQYAAKMEQSATKMRHVAVAYNNIKGELYNELNAEFAKDFTNWGATIDKDLTIRFNNEYILFNRGDKELKENFKLILADFFPRYLRIITSAHYRPSIEEVRIEGHTSSIWSQGVSPQEAYFRNMELSQARTRSALYYIMNLPQSQKELPWLRRYVTANGLSSARPVTGADGKENEALSQRVEFRIRTNAEEQLNNILQAAQAE